MELLDVLSVRATAIDGAYDVLVRISVDGVETEEQFGYQPNDPAELTGLVRQWLSDHQGDYTILPYAPPPPAPYQIAKTTPWLRMSVEEASIMDGVMQETDARTKQIYMAATYLSSGDPLWQTLRQILTDAFGSARADEILAPET